jgi:N-acetylmuramoyl-L-alanine amidase
MQAAVGRELKLVYPPEGHRTPAERIFLVGTSNPDLLLKINGQSVHRSPAGHFAPSFLLRPGANQFDLRQGDRQISRTVIRESGAPPALMGFAFGPGSLKPAQDTARLPGESVCFEAIAPAGAEATVQLGQYRVPLLPTTRIDLPANSAVLIGPAAALHSQGVQTLQGCLQLSGVGQWQPRFLLRQGNRTLEQTGPGQIEVLDPVAPYWVGIVTVPEAVIRSGPRSDYSRLTPLPQGTEAGISGWDGEWLRLDFGGWVKASEVQQTRRPTPPGSLIRGITSRSAGNWLEVLFPLQQAVPFHVSQGDHQLTLKLFNTTAQTDTIALIDNPLIERLDWQQSTPTQVEFTLKFKQHNWGYRLRYDGTTLLLGLRQPPSLQTTPQKPLQGLTLYLDPGHGSANDLGAVGPDGTPEKDLTLRVAQLLQHHLETLGVKVFLSRQEDEDLWPQDRAAQISRLQPNLALSLHYNALPDDGDAETTRGIGTFWYQPHAYSLARSLHDSLVHDLKRPSYGVFWNNLALARPTEAPSVLLELGFLINPEEAEWITDPQSQQELAAALTKGVLQWVRSQMMSNVR